MAFTNMDLVKKHILEHELGTVSKENVACRLEGETPFQLPHVLILIGSEKVKAKEQNAPTQESISFASSDAVQLAHPELIPDTVVVANDSSLGEIYVENVDYSIDYDDGRIVLIPSGSIPPTSSVVIWYLYFRIYPKDTDYEIDYTKGQIKRLATGDIEDGQWVLVDYRVEFALLGDEVIKNAINEANDQILKYIDSSYANSTDQSLVTAETYLAVSILSNIKAIEAMTQNVAAGAGWQAHSLSLAWSRMSTTYRERAYELLKRFKKDPGGFCSPYAAKSSN
ncbi:MAG: hypothetical protein KAX39_02030 [candidate division Zixibacteria bacterium]|nr:hypothetical protein [candidate division Zixibacteria bacterium]